MKKYKNKKRQVLLTDLGEIERQKCSTALGGEKQTSLS